MSKTNSEQCDFDIFPNVVMTGKSFNLDIVVQIIEGKLILGEPY